MSRSHTFVLLSVAASMVLAACSSPATKPGSSPNASGQSGENTLIVASWGGRFTQTTREFLVKPFERETGIDVRIVDVPGSQVTQLRAQRKAGEMQWDIMDSLSAGDAHVANGDGLLERLADDQKRRYAEALGADKVSEFGFSYASLGYIIACRKDVRCPTSVPEFFDVRSFPGERALPGTSPGPMTSILAEAANVELPQDVNKLLDPLRKLKPHVKVFYTSGDQQEQLIRQGEADMIIMYSGRAYSVRAGGTPLTINWAGAYDPGFTAQVTNAPHPEAARRFMDWVVQHPEAQAKWAEQMQYSVPSPKALEMLPTEVSERLADYPKNYERLGKQDFDWYFQNKADIDKALNRIIQGS